jgi:uncharacterized protein
MSELINNKDQRRDLLKGIILELHEGQDPVDLRERFRTLLSTAGATEIAELESELIAGGLPETEVKRLCDVHVAVFEDALEAQAKPETASGHPVHTFRAENRAAAEVIGHIRSIAGRLREADAGTARGALPELLGQVKLLRGMEKHYVRKEHLLFPYLERYGIKGPSSVMWALHDDIRAGFKRLQTELEQTTTKGAPTQGQAIQSLVNATLESMEGLFTKEDNILFPMALERLKEEEWLAIKQQSDDIGYFMVQPGNQWPIDLERLAAETPARVPELVVSDDGGSPIPFHTGALALAQLDLILTHLPVDITFVDEHDTVRYFSAGRERIFVRAEAVIGRKVQDCHPPASVHVVNRILNDFRAAKRDAANFWIQMGGRFVHIQYVALRDGAGTYRGTLEVSQDVTGIRALEGERRLLDE